MSATSRDDGAGSFHGAGATLSAPAPVVVGVDGGVVVDAVVAGARFEALPSPPPLPHAATNSASAQSSATRLADGGTPAPLHTKRERPESRPERYHRADSWGARDSRAERVTGPIGASPTRGTCTG